MWVKRFIYFHNVRHPAEMAESEINAFLTHWAVEKHVSASTQNQALSALLFLYRPGLEGKVGRKPTQSRRMVPGLIRLTSCSRLGLNERLEPFRVTSILRLGN